LITENLSTLKINKLTKAQYERELAAGNIDPNALYLTPDEGVDLSPYATVEQLKAYNKDCKDLVVLELKKNSHYIPMLIENDKYCALVGGDVSVIYKEKINTGSEIINVWHLKNK